MAWLGGFMEYAAIHHGMNRRNFYAVDKNRFMIRIRAKKGDMKRVVLHTQDKYLSIHHVDTAQQYEMEKYATDCFLDYYQVQISMDVICLRYYFELEDMEGKIAYYGNHSFFSSPIDNIDKMFDCPQNLREEEMYLIPDWAAGKVVYQIFPNRFATTEQVPDEVWYQTPMGHSENLRGNLRGIIQHLPHMKELGIDVIYMTPIFRSDSMHKYDTIDYYEIDPSFGTTDDLRELVDRAHELGMRVILDGVFNHTSQKFFAFADIMEKGEQSKYVDWYYIDGFPLKSKWGETPNFKTFGYFGGMPKLNLSNPEVAQYVTDVALYWIRNCHIDGWRLDVGDEVSHYFWKRFRQAVKASNPDVLLIGEVWHYAQDFLEGDEWDTVMNYHFYEAVKDFVAKECISASRFVEELSFMKGNIHSKVYPILWNLIDSHDTERFLHSSGEKKEKLHLAAAFQLLLPGMPMMYYGDEYGMTGGPDPDCRRGMVWKEEYQDQAMFAWYQRLLKARHNYPALTMGETLLAQGEDNQNLVKIVRNYQDETVTIIFHGAGEPVELSEHQGRRDLLTDEVFEGQLKPYEVVLFKD